MKQQVLDPKDLGLIVRAVRKTSGIRQTELAALMRVSKQFTTDLERGKPTLQLGLAMRLLNELGLRITVDVPEDALDELQRLRSKYGSSDSSDRSDSDSDGA